MNDPHTHTQAATMIEITCNDRLGKKIRIKCKYVVSKVTMPPTFSCAKCQSPNNATNKLTTSVPHFFVVHLVQEEPQSVSFDHPYLCSYTCLLLFLHSCVSWSFSFVNWLRLKITDIILLSFYFYFIFV